MLSSHDPSTGVSNAGGVCVVGSRGPRADLKTKEEQIFQRAPGPNWYRRFHGNSTTKCMDSCFFQRGSTLRVGAARRCCIWISPCQKLHTFQNKQIKKKKNHDCCCVGSLVFQVIAGVLLGPSALGAIPGFTDKLFPDDSLEALTLTAHLGLIL